MTEVDLSDLIATGAHVTYDKEAGAIYLKITTEDVRYTDTSYPNVNVDYDKQDRIVGVEVFV